MVSIYESLNSLPEIELDVMFWRDAVRTSNVLKKLDPGSGYKHRFVKGIKLPFPGGGTEKYSPELVSALKDQNEYDIAVICGMGPNTIAASRVLARRAKPWVYWGERIRPVSEPTLKTRLRDIWWKTVFRNATALFSIGTLGVTSYQNFNVDPERIFNIPYSNGTLGDRFISSAQPTNEDIRSIRDEWNATDQTCVLLFCGQIIKRKGVVFLRNVFAQVEENYGDVRLVLLGDGPLRESFKNGLSAEVASKIFCRGSVPEADLLPYFQASDIFLMPSHYDGWGVTLTQAACAGLPLIGSDTTGSSFDVIEENANGFVLPLVEEKWRTTILRMIQSTDLDKFGNVSVEKGRMFCADQVALKMRDALLKVVSESKPQK
jgi:glycosyltransferase involved in cell wall biosynthesis